MAQDIKHLGQFRFIATRREGATPWGGHALGGQGLGEPGCTPSQGLWIQASVGLRGEGEQPEQVGEEGGATLVSLEGRGSSETWPFTDTAATSFV